MSTIREKLSIIAKDKLLRKKVFFVVVGLIAFRLLAAIPVPGIDPLQLQEFFANNQFFGLLNVFSGSGLSTLSIVMLGVGPYITASIIMQLLTMVSPKLKATYQEDGEAGRIRFAQYSRRLSVPLAIIQAYSFLLLFTKQNLIVGLSPVEMATNIFVIVAGSMLLMWIGELITEYGIGNGTSMIIFAGIVSALPQYFTQLKLVVETDPGKLPMLIGFVFVALLVIWAVVVLTEAERSVPVTYSKQVRGGQLLGGMQTYLPIRINQAGVIPIIFALSILLFPQMIFNFLKIAENETVRMIAEKGLAILNQPVLYAALYFILVFVFTYFYTAVTFDPKNISEGLQKNGAFIPGVRPGQSTAAYLAQIVTRVTLVGALFLAVIAVLPLVMQGVSGNTAFAIGGTALLIVVSVVIDLIKKIEGQVSMRQY